jgi:hypothetical protein
LLTPSDLPVLRRATFQVPALESELELDSSKRRRKARSKRSGAGVLHSTSVESTADDAVESTADDAVESTGDQTAAPATGSLTEVAVEATTASLTVTPAEVDVDDETIAESTTIGSSREVAAAEGPALPEPIEVEAAETTATDGALGADAATGERARTSTTPRHRAERVRNRRGVAVTSSGKGKGTAAGVRRTAALGSAVAFIGLSAFGAIIPADAETSDVVASGAGAKSSSSAGDSLDAAALDSITPAPEAEAQPAITSGLSTAAAPFTGGTQVTVQGRSLDEVASVTVGTTPATIVAADEAQITFQVPAVAETTAGASLGVTLADAEGRSVEVVTTEAPISAAATTVASLITTADAADVQQKLAAGEKPAAPLVLTYTSDPAIDAQLQYVLAYWSSYNSAQYPVFAGVDCANFASQSLIARGWAMDAGWFFDGATGTMSSSWSSSTALRDYLLGQPNRATALDDSQRAQVKVGDIAQFDWDSSGDRDHTAVVTRVEHSDAGTKVWVGGHTKDIDYWDVDTALATGGGSVTYFSIH